MTMEELKFGRFMKPMVMPSGSAAASWDQPREPEPPSTFSITTVWPMYFSAYWARTRAVTSVPLPAL